MVLFKEGDERDYRPGIQSPISGSSDYDISEDFSESDWYNLTERNREELMDRLREVNRRQ